MAVSSRVRVDDMRVQCRYTCSSEYPEKCPEITILVIIFNFFPGGGPLDPGLGAPLGPTTPPTIHGRPTSNLPLAPLHGTPLLLMAVRNLTHTWKGFYFVR